MLTGVSTCVYCCLLAVTAFSVEKDEPHCLSRFDYDYKVIQKLVMLEQQQTELRETITQLQNALSTIGTTYVRWGRSVCPSENELVYKGYVGGSNYKHTGGAANWLCLSDEPQWGFYEDSVGAGAQIYGGEYEFGDHHSDGGSRYFKQNLNDDDAPCAVCRPPRPSVVMIPGRMDCYAGWTKEYSGYLIAGASSHASASEFICLDTEAEQMARGAANNDGKVIYLAEGHCGSLKCPPYVQGRELTCVVCSK